MSTARPSRNQMEKDRIMAGQNHAAPPLMVLPARILFLLRMILCGHDSVGLLGLPTKPSQLAHKLAYCSAEKRDPVCEPLRLRVKSSAGRTDIKMGGQENGIFPYSSSLIFLSSVFFLLPSVFRPPSSPSVLFAFSAATSSSSATNPSRPVLAPRARSRVGARPSGGHKEQLNPMAN